MKIVVISDTHERQDRLVLPEGDILIHAGDLTMRGSLPAIAAVAKWFGEQSFKHKIIISGNHDWCFQNASHDVAVNLMKEAGVTYLEDSGVNIDGISIWGSPWQPWFYDWAFNLPRGPKIAAKWALIPEDTNILITHGPAYGILDKCPDTTLSPSGHVVIPGERVGCHDLLKRIEQLPQLKMHICGHIHDSYGRHKRNGVQFINAASCDEKYNVTNKPIVVEV
jgi:Icc-related predicted phosphoesterase